MRNVEESNPTRYASHNMDKRMTPMPKARTQKQHMEMMLSFKVNPCKERKKKIDELHINTCFDWHPHAGDRRRSPKLYTYNIQQRCEEFHTTLYAAVAAQQGADKNTKTRAEGRCKNGDQCPSYHHKFEALYHPRFYKTNPCTFYTQKGRCTNKFCAFIHPGEEGDCPVLFETREKVKSILADCQRKLADARRAESNNKGGTNATPSSAIPALPSAAHSIPLQNVNATSSSPPASDPQDLSLPLPLPSSSSVQQPPLHQQQQQQPQPSQQQVVPFGHQPKYSAFNPWTRPAYTPAGHQTNLRASPTPNSHSNALPQLSSSSSASSAAGSAVSGLPPPGQQVYGEAHQYSGNLWNSDPQQQQRAQQQPRRVAPRGVSQPQTSRSLAARHSTMPVTAPPFYPSSSAQPRATAPSPSFDIFQMGNPSHSFNHAAFSPPPSSAVSLLREEDDGWSEHLNALQQHNGAKQTKGGASSPPGSLAGEKSVVPLAPFFLDSSADPIFRPTSRHTKPALGPISPRRDTLLPPPSAVTLLSPVDLNSAKNEEPISPGVLRNEREREEALERQMQEWEDLVEEKMWRDEAKKQQQQQQLQQQARLRHNLWGVTEPVVIGTHEVDNKADPAGPDESEGVHTGGGFRTMEEFLGALDLGKYVEVFERQEVDLELLRALSLNELTQNLGLPWGPAKKIVTKLQEEEIAPMNLGGMLHTQHGGGYSVFAPFMHRTANALTTEEDALAFFDADAAAAQSGWGSLRGGIAEAETEALMAGRMDIPLGY